MDGQHAGKEWELASWTEPFVDITGAVGKKPCFLTRAKLLWDDDFLYIGAWLEEPHVWGSLTGKDPVVFHDNDFELFLDPDDGGEDYYEFEINALGTVWDLRLVKSYREGGPVLEGWDLPGLRSAVWVNGTLNDPTDQDVGWGVAIALPMVGLAELSKARVPPVAGDIWRLNFSRVQWRHRIIDGRYDKLPNVPEQNWVWSPQGEIDMHLPRRWGYLEFC